MARHPKIRIRQNDKDEYRRLVRNTKAKIRRLNKNHGIDVSDQVEIPSLEQFDHRYQFNEFKDEMKRFTNRGTTEFQAVKNKYGVSALKGELRKIEENTRKAQELTREMIGNLEDRTYYVGGKEQSDVKQQILMMGESSITGIQVPVDFEFDNIPDRQRLTERAEAMERKTKPETYMDMQTKMKDNLLSLMEQGLNSYADDVMDELRNTNPIDFYQMFVGLDELDFALWSSPDGELIKGNDPQDVANALRRSVKQYKEDTKDMELEQFP